MSDKQAGTRTLHPAVLEVLTAAEIRALQGVRDDLADGTIGKEHFYMQDLIRDTGCGTAACICGHMGLRLVGEKEFHSWAWSLCQRPGQQPDPLTLLRHDLAPRPGQLYSLFAPWAVAGADHCLSHKWNEPARAVHAIDTFLETGVADWGV